MAYLEDKADPDGAQQLVNAMEGRLEDGVVNVILRREVCFVPKIRDDGNSDEGEPSLACRIGS